MEKETKAGNASATYDFMEKADKHYFAGFLNQADLNFRMALVELGKRCGKKHGANKANEGNNNESETISWINESFSDDLSLTDWNYRISILSNFLPFVRELYPKENELSHKKNDLVARNAFRSKLVLLYESLVKLRNYYTHLFHDEIELERKVFDVIDRLVLQATCTVRNRRLRNEIYRPALRKCFEKDFQEAKKGFEKRNEKLETGFDDKKNKRKYEEADFYRIYLNRAISKILDRNRDTGEFSLKDSQRSKRPDEGGKFSKNGFVFFLCLFLSRKDAEDILDHTTNFKAGYQLKYLVKRWAYTVFCYAGIRHSLQSEFSKEALLLQMVDELSKCPAELFDVLPEDKQQEFVMDRNDYFRDDEEDGNTPEESLVSHLVIRKRYQDKFPYLAIRFLDEFANFKSLRFQLRLGKYNHDTRTKTFKGIRTTTERSIKEEIKVFGKLSEVQKAKQAYFISKAEQGESPTKGWLKYPNVSYVLDNNNIPVYFSGFAEKQNPPTEKSRQTGILSELNCNEPFCPDSPHAFLSINELPACIHLFMGEASKNEKKRLSSKKTSPECSIGTGIECKIEGKVKSQYEFIRTVDRDTVRSDKNIPKRLLKSFKEDKVNGEIDFDKLTDAINKQIEDCDRKIRCLHSKKEEHEKNNRNHNAARKTYVLNAKEIGEAATWLVNDIKRYISKTDRKNWKSRHQTELQALFAFYDKRKADIELLLKEEMKIEISNYPFLEKMFEGKAFVEAYNAYLTGKKALLETFLVMITDNAHNYKKKAIRKAINELFDHFDRSKYTYIDTAYRNNLLQKPVNLPRGLFDDKKEEFSSKGNREGRQSWFASAEDAPKQAFYAYPRAYRVESGGTEEIKEFETHENSNDRVDFDTELKKRIATNEKRIRKIARQDYYLLEMVKFLFEELDIKMAGEITLADAFFERDDIRKNKQASHSQSHREKGDRSENRHRISNLLEQRIDIRLFRGKSPEITSKNRKLKDVGKYRALEKDERIVQLLSYPDRAYSTVDELVSEIENYERVRRYELYSAIHELEDTIYTFAEAKNETNELLKNGNPNFGEYIAYYSHAEEGFGNDCKNPLVIIRNRFSHNQLPCSSEYDCIKAKFPRKEDELIGDYLLRVFKSFTNSFNSNP